MSSGRKCSFRTTFTGAEATESVLISTSDFFRTACAVQWTSAAATSGTGSVTGSQSGSATCGLLDVFNGETNDFVTCSGGAELCAELLRTRTAAVAGGSSFPSGSSSGWIFAGLWMVVASCGGKDLFRPSSAFHGACGWGSIGASGALVLTAESTGFRWIFHGVSPPPDGFEMVTLIPAGIAAGASGAEAGSSRRLSMLRFFRMLLGG